MMMNGEALMNLALSLAVAAFLVEKPRKMTLMMTSMVSLDRLKKLEESARSLNLWKKPKLNLKREAVGLT